MDFFLNVAAVNEQNSCIYIDRCQYKAQDNRKEEEQAKQKQKCTVPLIWWLSSDSQADLQLYSGE